MGLCGGGGKDLVVGVARLHQRGGRLWVFPSEDENERFVGGLGLHAALCQSRPPSTSLKSEISFLM